MIWNGVEAAGRISTGSGVCRGTPGAAPRSAFSRGLAISLPSALSVLAARPTPPWPLVVSRSAWIFPTMLAWYRGRFPAKCANWVPISPAARITAKASPTTAMTAITRLTCQRRSRSTAGPRAKLRRMASAIGIKTSRPKYSAATTTTPTARVPRLVGEAAPAPVSIRSKSAAGEAAGAAVSGMEKIFRIAFSKRSGEICKNKGRRRSRAVHSEPKPVAVIFIKTDRTLSSVRANALAIRCRSCPPQALQKPVGDLLLRVGHCIIERFEGRNHAWRDLIDFSRGQLLHRGGIFTHRLHEAVPLRFLFGGDGQRRMNAGYPLLDGPPPDIDGRRGGRGQGGLHRPERRRGGAVGARRGRRGGNKKRGAQQRRKRSRMRRCR